MNRTRWAIAVWMSCGLISACSDRGSASAAASKWPTQWCQALPGMPKEQIIALMGPPTGTPPQQLTWSDDHYGFYAFLKDDGTAEQLDTNPTNLTPAEVAALQCKTTRTRRTMEAEARAEARAKAKAPGKHRLACDLITQADMSTIVGSPVVAVAGPHSDTESQCVFNAASGDFPHVEVSVALGDGASGMQAGGLVQFSQKGAADPYAGIGDQAVAAGPMLLIRTGDDLVTLVIMGVKDPKTAAKKIFDTVKAGL